MAHSDQRTIFLSLPHTSSQYFHFLLTNLPLPPDSNSETPYPPSIVAIELLSGLVGSADTGSEDLIRASRAALVEYCNTSPRHAVFISDALFTVVKINSTSAENKSANDRVLVPALEVMGFLFDCGILGECGLK